MKCLCIPVKNTFVRYDGIGRNDVQFLVLATPIPTYLYTSFPPKLTIQAFVKWRYRYHHCYQITSPVISEIQFKKDNFVVIYKAF